MVAQPLGDELMAAALDAFLAARGARAFEYFAHDCAHLAADWVLAKTGADPMAPLRVTGEPLAARRLLTAMRYVRAQGGFRAAGDALLGAHVAGLAARRGDVALVATGRRGRVSGWAFGICTGRNVVAPGLDGLTYLPISAAEAAWHV